MSKLPKISAHNSDAFKSTFNLGQENGASTSSSLSNDLPLLYSHNTQTNNQINLANTNSTRLHPLITESKLNDIETKILALEESNAVLMDRIRTYERSFDLQLKDLQLKSNEEKDSRFKAEKILNIITDQNAVSTNDIKGKIGFIQDILEKEDKWKYEQRERDMELYKNLINKLTDKVSETVKLEIEARFKADLDNKLLTQNVTNKFSTEIDVIRKEMDDVSTETKLGLKENSKECAERTHNLSKYVDQIIAESLVLPGQNFDQLKNFVHKLTDQIKTNLVSQNNQNEIFDKKIISIEQFTNNIKDDIYKFISTVEDRLINKMKDLKAFTEINLKKNFDVVNTRINELSYNTDNNINLVSSQLIETRNKINQKFEQMETNNLTKFKATCEDIEAIANRVYLYENLLEDYDKRNNEMRKKCEEDIAGLQTAFDVHNVNERIVHTIENDLLIEEIDKTKEMVGQLGNKIQKDMDEMVKNFEANYRTLFDRSNMAFEQMNKLAENNFEMFEELDKNIQKLFYENDRMEINNIMKEMLNGIDHNSAQEDIQKSKEVEHYLHDIIHNLDSELKTLNTNIRDQSIRTDVTKVMEDMLIKIDIDEMIKAREDSNEALHANEAQLLQTISKLEKKIEAQEMNNDTKLFSLNEELQKMRAQHDQEMEDKAKRSGEKTKKLEEKKKRKESEKKNSQDNNPLSTTISTDLEVKLTLDQMINNMEFNNIYNLLDTKLGKNDQMNQEVLDKLNEFNKQIYKIDKEFSETNDTTKKVLIDYSDVIDSKIIHALERIKKENVDMWVNAVELSQKVNQPEEIRKIIQLVPPVVIPKKESLQKILELEHDQNKFPKPLVPKLEEELKAINKKQNENQEPKKESNWISAKPEPKIIEDPLNHPNNIPDKELKPDDKAKPEWMSNVKKGLKEKVDEDLKEPADTKVDGTDKSKTKPKEKDPKENLGGELKKDPRVSNKNIQKINK